MGILRLEFSDCESANPSYDIMNKWKQNFPFHLQSSEVAGLLYNMMWNSSTSVKHKQ